MNALQLNNFFSTNCIFPWLSYALLGLTQSGLQYFLLGDSHRPLALFLGPTWPKFQGKPSRAEDLTLVDCATVFSNPFPKLAIAASASVLYILAQTKEVCVFIVKLVCLFYFLFLNSATFVGMVIELGM